MVFWRRRAPLGVAAAVAIAAAAIAAAAIAAAVAARRHRRTVRRMLLHLASTRLVHSAARTDVHLGTMGSSAKALVRLRLRVLAIATQGVVLGPLITLGVKLCRARRQLGTTPTQIP